VQASLLLSRPRPTADKTTSCAPRIASAVGRRTGATARAAAPHWQVPQRCFATAPPIAGRLRPEVLSKFLATASAAGSESRCMPAIGAEIRQRQQQRLQVTGTCAGQPDLRSPCFSAHFLARASGPSCHTECETCSEKAGRDLPAGAMPASATCAAQVMWPQRTTTTAASETLGNHSGACYSAGGCRKIAHSFERLVDCGGCLSYR
jgi:hypothetical protein